MEPILIIEVRDRGGELQTRHRLDKLPVTVGRAYQNDIIVDDQYVCPQHLRVSQGEAGEVVVEDLHSVNGLYRTHPHVAVKSATVQSDLTLQIGQTQLRCVLPSVAVAPTVHQQRRSIGLDRPYLAAVLLVLYLSWSLFDWLIFQNDRDFTGGELLIREVIEAVGLVVGLSVWSTIWAVPSRINRRKAYFFAHFSLGLIAITVWQVSVIVISWAKFAFAIAGYESLMIVLGLLTLAFLLSAHLRFATRMSLRARRLVGAGAFLIPFSLFSAVVLWGDDGFSNYTQFESELKPSSARLVKGRSTEELLNSFSSLKAQVDELKKS